MRNRTTYFLLFTLTLFIQAPEINANIFDDVLESKKEQINLQKCKNAALMFSVVSLINRDKKLSKFAEDSTKDSQIQKELDSMITKLSLGHKNVGIGFHPANNGYGYYRGSHGGRVFIKRYGDILFILGKASKKGSDNENKVMRRLEKLYPDLEFLGSPGI